jgi:hypothetical protein
MCHQCALDSHAQGDKLPIYGMMMETLYNSDGLYELECINGHKFVMVLQAHLFEVLFQVGAFAILDGYYREAVVTFAASLERFYEFFVKAKWYQKKIEPNDQELIAVYRQLSRSEPQLGAYIASYYETFEKAPRLLKSADAEFRNNVVHNGKIPSKSEATEFGQLVLDIIQPVIDDMKSAFPDGIKKSMTEHMDKAQSKAATRTNMSSVMPTIISVSCGSSDKSIPNLQEKLDALKKYDDAMKRHAAAMELLRG